MKYGITFKGAKENDIQMWEWSIELKRTGTLPEAGNLKPKFGGSGGITRPPCENRARPFAKYKQNPGRKLQEMS